MPPAQQSCGAWCTAGASAREVHSILAKLLLKEPFGSLTSVIVYVAFQAAAEEAAKFLRSHGINSACYHAGRPAKVPLLCSL